MQSGNLPNNKSYSAFPSLQQTAENYGLVYSDHLPIYTQIPINKNTKQDIKALSYNVMGACVENNLTRILEDEEKLVIRYSRIAMGLKTCADNLELDVILLQEVSSSMMIIPLAKALGEEWCIQPGVAEIELNPSQQLTCYRKSRLQPVDNVGLKQNMKFNQYNNCSWDSKNKTLFSNFVCQSSGKLIHICNVWSEYNIFPNATEKYYYTLLMNKQESEVVVVLGDTNSRIAPLDNNERNLTTGIIPAIFNKNYNIKDEVQIPDHPDGGFYSLDDSIHQLVVIPVNIINGEALDDKNLKSVALSIPQCFRPILCLDESYKTKKLVQDRTIYEYEAELQDKLKDKNISVRLTSTILNRKGILLRFSPKSACFQVLKGVLKDENGISFDMVDSVRGLIPCIYAQIENIDTLTKIIDLYYALEFECAELNKLLKIRANIPEQIIEIAAAELASLDTTYPSTAQEFGLAIENILSAQVFIKAYPSFYQDSFLKGVLDYAVYGGDTDEVAKFLDFIKDKIELWIKTPPKNTEYAKEFVGSIISSYIFKKYERLKPIKGKLYFLQALIHQYGLFGVLKNEKQAIACFNDAAFNGNKEAYVKLGEIELQKAILGNSDDVFADNPHYISAVQYFERAGELGYLELSRAIFMNYKQSLHYGNITEAFNCLAYLEDLITSNPAVQQVISPDQLAQEKSYFNVVKKSINDAMKIEAHYINCQSLDLGKMEQVFLVLKDKVKVEDNPVYDYYHFLILSTTLRLMKSSSDEKLKDQIVQQRSELMTKLLNSSSYSKSQQGAYNYVCGLASNDQIPELSKAFRKEASSKEYFMFAILKGFPLAYSYLANIAEMENDEKCYIYYLRGSLAGDPRCQISFFHRFLQQKLNEVIQSGDVKAIISFSGEMLTILNLAINNENIVESNRSYIEQCILLIEMNLAGYTYKIKELTSEFWNDKNNDYLEGLKAKIESYENSKPGINQNTLINLYVISDCIVDLLGNNSTLTRDDEKVLRKLLKDISATIGFFEEKFSQDKLNDYANMAISERIVNGFNYFSESGHMDAAYYLEHIDPRHRMAKMISNEWNSSVFHDYPFIQFLQKYNSSSSDIPQVIYLNEYQKQGLVVENNVNNKITYQRNNKLLADGKYLFVLDKRGKLYLANEKDSFDLPINKMFQHTSILSGGHVQCAGEIQIKDGNIININNGSGHYIPSVRQLFQAIAYLKRIELIDITHPEFRIGIFGVSKIPNFNGDILNLTLSDFLDHFDAIVQVESDNRDLKAFEALIKHSDTASNEVDPYKDKTCKNSYIIYAMKYLQNAEHLIRQYQSDMLKTKWTPGFFDKNEVVIEGVKYVLPGDIYNKLKIISNAVNSNNWVECLEKLSLVQDDIVMSLLHGRNVNGNPKNKHDIGHHGRRY